MVQNHSPKYKSQVALEDLYWMQASLIINSTEAYYSDVCTGRRLQDWIVQCFTSPPTQYRLYGRRRRRDGWPTSRQATLS